MEIVSCGVLEPRPFFNVDITSKRIVPVYELEFYETSGGESFIDGTSYRHDHAHILFLQPGMEQFSIGVAMRYSYVYFWPDADDKAFLHDFPVYTAVTNAQTAQRLSEYFDTFRVMCPWKYPDLLTIKAETLRILTELSALAQEQTNTPGRTVAAYQEIMQAKEYIEQHYGEKITLSDLAQLTYLSKNYLRQRFAEAFGVSPQEYLTHIRVAKAIELLREQSLSQKEIAYVCGFSSQSHMISTIRKLYGKTPRQLIAQLPLDFR